MLEEHDSEEWSEPVGDYIQEVFHDFLQVVAACNCGSLFIHEGQSMWVERSSEL